MEKEPTLEDFPEFRVISIQPLKPKKSKFMKILDGLQLFFLIAFLIGLGMYIYLIA